MAIKPVVTIGDAVNGRRSVTIGFPVQHLARGRDEVSSIWEETVAVKLSQAVNVDRIWAFLGVDQGNAGEFAIDLQSDGLRLYQTSMHKEASHGIYDAWDMKDLRWSVRLNQFTIHLLGHPTGGDANIQFEFILEGAA